MTPTPRSSRPSADEAGVRVRGAVLLVTALSVAASGCFTMRANAPGPHEAFGAKADIILKDIPYVTGVPDDEDLQLDVYSNPHQGLWPAVVVIHGGSWVRGSKNRGHKVFLSKWLANHGFVAFSINYRLAPFHTIKTQVEDVMAAVIWVKKHAAEFGVDPERVAVAGGSAGGHLAALVAWASRDPYFHPTGVTDTTINADVKAAALFYPVIDFDRTIADNGRWFATLARKFFTGETGQAYDDELKHISPINHMTAHSVPTIVLTGDEDQLQLYPQSVECAETLTRLGVDTQLFTAKQRKHTFIRQYWDPVSLESVDATTRFLERHLRPASFAVTHVDHGGPRAAESH